jgi:hypothetical protein
VNRGIYGLGGQAANGIAASTLWAPGQSVGLYARVVPWFGYPNADNSTSTGFAVRQIAVIGTDPIPSGNNGSVQATALAIQIPNFSSAFIVAPGVSDSNYATQGQGVTTGAARGQGAIDIQTYRTGSSQVASGQFATAVGQLNTVSGTNAVAAGYQNTASGSQAAAMGYNNTASGTSSCAFGYQNTVSTGSQGSGFGVGNSTTGTQAIAAGYSNTASGTSSAAVGWFNTAGQVQSSVVGSYGVAQFPYSTTLSGNRFSSSGDSELIFARQGYQTTTATASQMFGDNTSGTSRLTIAVSTSYAWKLQLVARQTGGAAGTAGDTAVWNIEGGVYRTAAGNTTLLGSVTTSYMAVTAAAAWTAVVSADTVNQALVVTITGEASKNINWVAFWQLVRSA